MPANDANSPMMPDGIAAAKRSTPPLPPLTMPPPSGGGAPPALSMPPPASAPMGAPPPGAPAGMPMPPGPMQPIAPPPQPTVHDLIPGIHSEIQDNGKVLITGAPIVPGGKPQIIDVLDAPKIARALQPPKQKGPMQ